MNLDEIADRVRSRADFVEFLDALLRDLELELARPEEETRWGAGDWSHPDLRGFFETFAAALRDSERFADLPPEAWQAFSEMLLAARVYE